MLALRLKEGIDIHQYEKKFGIVLRDTFYNFLELLKKQELLAYENGRIWLTDKGMLLSNTVIIELLERII